MKDEMYHELLLLNESNDKRIYLVQHQVSKILYVKKIIAHLDCIQLYDQLLKHPHPYMANIIEFDNREDNCIIIEEFVNGTTLEYALSCQAFSLAQLQTIFIELFDVLQHIHALQPPIIHRDIKQANIMIEKNHLKLIDFDIARNIKLAQKKDTQIIGSVGYAAPEQYGFAQSDQRSDIYAVGVLINELLVNGNADSVYKSISERCIAFDPSSRYQSIQELRYAFLKHKVINNFGETTITSYSFNIPGFNKERLWQKIIIYAFYALGLFLALRLERVSGTSYISYLAQRIAILIICILMLWVPCNVGHILEMTPFYRSKTKFIRFLNGVLIFFICGFISLFTAALLSVLLEQIL